MQKILIPCIPFFVILPLISFPAFLVLRWSYVLVC